MAVKTFDEVVLFARTGLNPRTNFKLGNGENKYITIKNIHNNELVIDENTDVIDDDAIELIHKRSKIKKGDILFCSIGRMGDMYIIPEEPVGWDINESVFAFTVNTDIVRQKYFYYIFKNQGTIKYLSKNSSGSTFKSIKMNQLKKMVFDLPSLSKQDKIVEVLDRLSLIIKKREEELCKLDELIKARFVEMFGDTVINPMGWKEQKLDEYITFLTSGSRGWAQYFTNEENELFITIKNVKNNHITIDDIQYVDAPENKEAERTKVKAGDLLISITADLGRTGVVDDIIVDRGAYINQHLSLVRLNQDKINPLYVSYFLETSGGKRQFESKNQNGVKAGLNFEAIKSLKILVPPLEMQEQYLDFVKQVDKSKVVDMKIL
ncbi:MAG: restriction endonuclease subunit S [Eubacterium sp.]|nr:restriction endonuclease subunit S [Eubacterium sp.]